MIQSNFNTFLALADGAVCAVLEGGYFVPSLSEGAALTLRSLLGDPCPLLPYPVSSAPNPAMEKTIHNVQCALAKYWPVFSQHRDKEPILTVWEGPSEPEGPPFDIMCPTPVR